MLGVWILLSSTLMFVYASHTRSARRAVQRTVYSWYWLRRAANVRFLARTAQSNPLTQLALLSLQAGLLAMLWAGRQMAIETGDGQRRHQRRQ